MVAVGQRGTVNMPLPVRGLRRRHRGAAVNTHHHAERVRIGADSEARRGVAGLVVTGGTGVVAQGDHRRRHAGVHRHSQRGGGLHVPRVVGHLHRDAVVPVRQFRGGKGPRPVRQCRRVSGAVDQHLHADHVGVDIPQREGRGGIPGDVVAVAAAAV